MTHEILRVTRSHPRVLNAGSRGGGR
jgi:hypothetical protein